MNTADVEGLLHQHARRWAQRQPEPPPVPALPPAAPSWRSRVLVVAACLVVGIVAALAVPAWRGADSAHHSGGAGVSGPVSDRLTQLVDGLARPAHGPVTAQAVRTTYRRAEATVLDGDTSSTPAPDVPVWVVQVRGDFDCGGCKIPPNTTAPHGRVFTLVVTADDYSVTDQSLGNQLHDLTRLGTVTDLIR